MLSWLKTFVIGLIFEAERVKVAVQKLIAEADEEKRDGSDMCDTLLTTAMHDKSMRLFFGVSSILVSWVYSSIRYDKKLLIQSLIQNLLEFAGSNTYMYGVIQLEKFHESVFKQAEENPSSVRFYLLLARIWVYGCG